MSWSSVIALLKSTLEKEEGEILMENFVCSVSHTPQSSEGFLLTLLEYHRWWGLRAPYI